MTSHTDATSSTAPGSSLLQLVVQPYQVQHPGIEHDFLRIRCLAFGGMIPLVQLLSFLKFAVIFVFLQVATSPAQEIVCPDEILYLECMKQPKVSICSSFGACHIELLHRDSLIHRYVEKAVFSLHSFCAALWTQVFALF